MAPPTMRAGSSSSRIRDSAVTLLPDPLSPTMPSVSPGPTVKDTPSTARTAPASVRKTVRRSSTSNTGVSAAVAPVRAGRDPSITGTSP